MKDENTKNIGTEKINQKIAEVTPYVDSTGKLEEIDRPAKRTKYG